MTKTVYQITNSKQLEELYLKVGCTTAQLEIIGNTDTEKLQKIKEGFEQISMPYKRQYLAENLLIEYRPHIQGHFD